MLDIAQHDNGNPVRIKDISSRQEISDKYLEQIISILNKAGFVRSIRGPQGGYLLTHTPEEYTVGMILRLTEGSLAPVSCLTPGASACARMANCRTYEMWKGLNDLISDYFGKITLADLALPDQAGNDYVI